MNKINIIKAGYVGGTFFVAFFLVCTTWGALLGTPALKELHLSLLQVTFPGFSFAVSGYVLGLVEAFAYGWFGGVFFTWLCKKMCANDEK